MKNLFKALLIGLPLTVVTVLLGAICPTLLVVLYCLALVICVAPLLPLFAHPIAWLIAIGFCQPLLVVCFISTLIVMKSK